MEPPSAGETGAASAQSARAAPGAATGGARAREGTLRANTIAGTLVNASGLGLGLISQVVLAAVLSIEGYGIYTYVVTLLGLVLLATRHGWDVILIRYVAAYREREEWQLLRGLLRQGFTLPSALSLAVGAGVSLLGVSLGTPLGAALVIAGPALVLWTLLSLASGALIGLGRVVLGNGLQSLLRPAAFLALLGGVALSQPEPLGGREAMLLYALSLGIALAFGGVATWRSVAASAPREAGAPPLQPLYRTREWVLVALPLTLAVAADLLLRRTDVIMVGALLDTTSAGIYRVGALGAELSLIVVIALETAFMPLCSRRYAAGDLSGLRSLVRKASLASFVSTALAAAFLWVAGEALIAWLRVEFTPAYPALAVLCLGQVVAQLFGPTRPLAMMVGHQRAAAWAAGLGCALNLILNLALIQALGLVGAAYGTAITLLVTRLGLYLHLRRHAGIDASIFSGLLPEPSEPEWVQAQAVASASGEASSSGA